MLYPAELQAHTRRWQALRFGNIGTAQVPKGKQVPGTGVEDGARTRDIGNHNPALYQLSYIHR